MSLLTIAGATMLGTSVYKMINNTPKAELKRILRTTLNSLDGSSEKNRVHSAIKIQAIERAGQVFTVTFKLPAGFASDEFSKLVKYLAEASYAGDARFKHNRGNLVDVMFGFERFEERMLYSTNLIDPERPLAIPLFSPFGTIYLDFGDETCCHLLTGGSSRMGKSVFLRLLATHLLLATDGKIQLYFIDNKITDLHMFRDIPQIHDAETSEQANECLDKAIGEINRRKEILKKAGDVEDVKSYRKKYPNSKMDSIFIVIDEYARFAEDDEIQEKVTFVAETAGYLDVHLVIASQRPDVKDVLKPRIRGNLLARMAFSTPDEANSKIILDMPDAAYLGRIRGRAVYSDGFPNKVQVPFIDADVARNLLKKYVNNGWWNLRHEQPGPENSSIPKALQDLQSRSVGDPSSSGEQQPAGNHKPSRKKTSKRGGNPSGSAL